MPETGDDASGGEAHVGSPERHYRVTLDFRLRLRPLTPELCRESLFFDAENANASADEQHLRENVERQRRLYALLLNDERVLGRFLLAAVAHEAAGVVFGGLSEAFGVAEDEDLLAPLYGQLSEEDATYFEARAEVGSSESTEPVAKAFEVEWVGAEFAEMSRRVVGRPKKAVGGGAGEDAPVKGT